MDYEELAECNQLSESLAKISVALEQFLRFEHPDALRNRTQWQTVLSGDESDHSVPQYGIGFERVVADISEHLIPNGSAIPNPGCTSFITTGATTVAALAGLSGSIASPQRLGLTAFNFLEDLSMQWLKTLFELPQTMQGIYSSGGSVANLVALGAARQAAFESIGLDPARDGVQRRCRLYASAASHHTIHRAAAILGMGRQSVVSVPTDQRGRMSLSHLHKQMATDATDKHLLPVAIIANAGTTDTGAIDPIEKLSELAKANNIWLHIDGAYGLPGILDPEKKPLFKGIELADSVIVDPHKWLGAPVGVGATFVKDGDLLKRAFTQESAFYLEGSFYNDQHQHSMDHHGVPYTEMGVELSAPPRGAMVWALIREIGKIGLQNRVCRHNRMATALAEKVLAEPELELVMPPTLSICCFRYTSAVATDLNKLNQRIHRQLLSNGKNMPSTTVIDGKLVLRPCFLGARTTWHHVDDLLNEVLSIGRELVNEYRN